MKIKNILTKKYSIFKMPIDQRRINGPDVSIPYYIYSNLNKKSDKIKHDFNIRNDKRANNEMRKICKIKLFLSYK